MSWHVFVRLADSSQSLIVCEPVLWEFQLPVHLFIAQFELVTHHTSTGGLEASLAAHAYGGGHADRGNADDEEEDAGVFVFKCVDCVCLFRCVIVCAEWT